MGPERLIASWNMEKSAKDVLFKKVIQRRWFSRMDFHRVGGRAARGREGRESVVETRRG